jgi:hypothetical protein
LPGFGSSIKLENMRSTNGEPLIKAPTDKLELVLEKTLIEKLKVMADASRYTQDELVTIALKRFISQHKDYFPEQHNI